MNQLIICTLTFLAVVLPVVYFCYLAPADPHRQKMDDNLPALFTITAPAASLLDALGFNALFRTCLPRPCARLQKQLHYAGIALKPERVIATQMALLVLFTAIAFGCTFMLVAEENRFSALITGAIAALIGWSLPGIAIGNRAQKRQDDIFHALPYSIDLVVSAMRGGLDFSAAIRFYVTLGSEGPLTDEYRQMLREMELGILRTTALQNMAQRINIKEFTSFAAAVALGTELGAPLTDVMDQQSEEMRKIRFSIAECKAQTAPSKMLLPMALFIMPAVFIIILTPVFLQMKEAGVSLF